MDEEDLDKTETSSENPLDKTLSCSVCLTRYTKPKVLPCSHVFCLHCLENIQTDSFITCPLCRNKCGKASDSLPPSLNIESLLEISNFETMIQGEKMVDSAVQCDNCQCMVDRSMVNWCKQCAVHLCPDCLHYHSKWRKNIKHEVFSMKLADRNESISQLKQSMMSSLPQQPAGTISSSGSTCKSHEILFNKFCSSCKHTVCVICSETKHKCSTADNITSDIIQFLEKKTVYLQESLKLLVSQKDTITKQAEVVKEEIHGTVAEIISGMKEKERNLISEVDEALHLKYIVLDGQIEEVKAELDRFGNCSSNMVHLAKLDATAVPDEQYFSSTKRQVLYQVENTVSSIKGKVFTPLEKADLKFVRNTSDGNLYGYHFGSLKVICIASSIVINFTIKQFKKTTSYRDPDPTTTYQKASNEVSFKLKLKLGSYESIRLPPALLQCKSDKDLTNVTIVESEPGLYTVNNNYSTVSIFISGHKIIPG